MTTEDNYNKPARTIADWIAEGYTEAYAKALDAQQKRADAKKQNVSAYSNVGYGLLGE
jgi:predicted metalloprotease with PDZ domain